MFQVPSPKSDYNSDYNEEELLKKWFGGKSEFEIWSPFDSFEVAEILMKMIKEFEENERDNF